METIKIFILLALVYFIYKYINQQPILNVVNNTNIEVDWIDEEYGFGYGNMTPKKSLQILIRDYGNPSVIDATRGGFAVWDRDTLDDTPFERIEIKDEQILHDKPMPHVDCIYSYYRINIPEHLIKNLQFISKSITYDPIKKLMSSRCCDMKANIIAHWIVKQYANYQLSIDEAGNMYGPMVSEIFEDESGMKALELLSEL